MTNESVMHELDHREADGISVTLWWFTPDDELMVTVHDSKTHQNFTLNDVPKDRAKEYFDHPFAGRILQEVK